MPGGRPTKMTELAIQKLEEAFLLGCTDLEACLYADISESTLYNYQSANPEFVERKELLKRNPVLKARQSVLDHIKDDGNLALKYLERKCKDEFGLKSEVVMTATLEDKTDQELDNEIRSLSEDADSEE